MSETALPEQAAEPVVAKGDAALQKPPKPAGRGAPKWETEARDRVRAAVRRFNKPLIDLIARDANEGDTRLLVTDFLCDCLGYDKYEDLTTEYQVKGEFADYGVRIDKQLVAFIEVKRCATKLGVKHLRQVEMYAVNEGVEWMILTNGQVWQVYHLTAGLPVVIDLALEVDLLGEGGPAHKADALFYLSKDAFKRRLIDELWHAKAATSAKSLASVLLSEAVVEATRKELRRQTSHNVDVKELARLLRSIVIRPDAL
jgi:predicted type IV restriction endonuclease